MQLMRCPHIYLSLTRCRLMTSRENSGGGPALTGGSNHGWRAPARSPPSLCRSLIVTCISLCETLNKPRRKIGDLLILRGAWPKRIMYTSRQIGTRLVTEAQTVVSRTCWRHSIKGHFSQSLASPTPGRWLRIQTGPL